MREKPSILMLHNRYLIRGGEDESTEAEAALLRAKGHEVTLLDRMNFDPASFRDKLHLATQSIWSADAYREVRDLLATGRYDIVHVQNFFPQFSPAVHRAAASAGVPVVQAVRNYRLVCPSANLFRDGQLCTDCVGKTVALPAIVHGCYRGSRLGSAAIAAMQTGHRAIGTWRHKVSAYVALTEYLRDVLVKGGFPANKLHVKPNFVQLPEQIGEAPYAPGSYALYVGRLTEEKGLDLLARNWREVGLPLKIVGEGPAAEALAAADPSIEVLGRRPLHETYALMRGARFVVLPVRWPEPFGRVAIEAFANGTPVLAAAAGGLTEIVDEGRTGMLFAPGDDAAFVVKARRMAKDDAMIAAMRDAARDEYWRRFSPDVNYTYLSYIYRIATNPD